MSNQYAVVQQFEQALSDYAGSAYCVTTTSCTSALLLAMLWHKRIDLDTIAIEIPKRTYIGVGMSIVNAGYKLKFRDDDWTGIYALRPTKIYDSARWLSDGMYTAGTFTCLSFHWSKHLGIGQGGAIIHDDGDADEFFRRARFDGRRAGVDPREDMTDIIGHHCYMSPRDAADGLSRLAALPKINMPLPNSEYPDLSVIPAFKKYTLS